MPEDQIVESQPIEGMRVITPEGNIFEDSGWSDTPIVRQSEATENVPRGTKDEKQTVNTDADEIVDELEYLERQTGYKSWDDIKALKAEAEQLRTKTQTPAERKFANEESKRLAEAWEAGKTDEVFEYLNTQRQLKKAADLPSADAIKLHIRETNKSNPHFTQEDVEDVFEERYSIPKKPIQGVNEDPEEFQERMTEYNTRVAKVNRAIERDGFAAKQDLAKRITELVPPEIPKQQTEEGPTQEVLEARKAFVENFRKETPKQLSEIKGFSTTFKDDDVEFSVSHGIRPEDLAPYKAELEEFANNGLDVNTLFTKRWLNQDGTVNIQRAAEDLYLRDNRDKILKSIATETGMQRMKEHRKQTNNIKINGETKVVEMGKTEKGSQAEAIDKLWNEA